MTNWTTLNDALETVTLWQAVARLARANGATDEQAAEAATAILITRLRGDAVPGQYEMPSPVGNSGTNNKGEQQ